MLPRCPPAARAVQVRESRLDGRTRSAIRVPRAFRPAARPSTGRSSPWTRPDSLPACPTCLCARDRRRLTAVTSGSGSARIRCCSCARRVKSEAGRTGAPWGCAAELWSAPGVRSSATPIPRRLGRTSSSWSDPPRGDATNVRWAQYPTGAAAIRSAISQVPRARPAPKQSPRDQKRREWRPMTRLLGLPRLRRGAPAAGVRRRSRAVAMRGAARVVHQPAGVGGQGGPGGCEPGGLRGEGSRGERGGARGQREQERAHGAVQRTHGRSELVGGSAKVARRSRARPPIPTSGPQAPTTGTPHPTGTTRDPPPPRGRPLVRGARGGRT